MDNHGYLHENNTHNRDFVRQKMIEHQLKYIWRERERERKREKELIVR